MNVSASSIPVQLAYLITSVCFIVGLKRLSSPRTARSGNQIAAVGMLVAVIATWMQTGAHNQVLILAAVALGAGVGAVAARRVAMTDMPQMVGLLNGVGGGAAALVSAVEYMKFAGRWHAGGEGLWSVLAGTLIGAVSFAGSMIAFGKLQGLVNEKPITYPGQKAVNFALLVAILLLGAFLLAGHAGPPAYWGLFVGSLLLGVMMVLPIGGADMPVVISILNAFTGLAAAATGFALHNYALVISGTLVGASGTILTTLMCKAMNRSLANVLFGAFGAVTTAGAGGTAAAATRKPVREVTADDAAVLMANSQKVIIIPGYGMAVAQAQHVVRELAQALQEQGVQVKYAIHPVAGRMPGHMNVLLAEANVPYTDLFDLDDINPEFPETDVALVIGANDVVNPAARHDKQSPIYGMPILDADKARHVIIIKRSLNPGFAGIDNELYYNTNTLMLFGDAKEVLTRLVRELKAAA